MALFIVLGVVVSIAVIVLGFLFFMFSKEGQKTEKEKVVPITDLKQIKEELSTGSPWPPQSHEVKSSSEDDVHKKRVQELEEELRKENQLLKNQQADFEAAQQKLAGFEEAQQKLAGLQTQLESANDKVRLLEGEIVQLNATVSELKRENEAALSAVKTAPDEALRQELETLKYELIKARAQSSGLERVSFNYKNQLEDFLKKINAAQTANDHLSQVKNRLEGTMEEVKSQNEALARKDQLVQFELEKNRTRLINLERECEELKARLR